MNASKFQKGDVVHWTSQSHGTHNTKRGTIIEVVAPGIYPSEANKITGQPGGSRREESYVVAVTHVNGKQIAGVRGFGGRVVFPRKPKNYWPIVKALKLSSAPSVLAPETPVEHKQTTCHQTAE